MVKKSALPNVLKLIHLKRRREIRFHPRAREALRSYPEEVRYEFGRTLQRVQEGIKLSMPQSRPLPVVASGAHELRVRGADGIYRVFYFTSSPVAIMVFHAFVKKTRKSPALQIQLARARLKEMVHG